MVTHTAHRHTDTDTYNTQTHTQTNKELCSDDSVVQCSLKNVKGLPVTLGTCVHLQGTVHVSKDGLKGTEVNEFSVEGVFFSHFGAQGMPVSISQPKMCG